MQLELYLVQSKWRDNDTYMTYGFLLHMVLPTHAAHMHLPERFLSNDLDGECQVLTSHSCDDPWRLLHYNWLLRPLRYYIQNRRTTSQLQHKEL